LRWGEGIEKEVGKAVSAREVAERW
jgi:hypothetical protein